MKAHQVETYFKAKDYYATSTKLEFKAIAETMNRLKKADTKEDKLDALIDLWNEAFYAGYESF